MRNTLLLVAVIILALLVVPVMRNIGAVPMIVVALIVLALASGTNGTVASISRGVAGLILILGIISFFLPKTAGKMPTNVDRFDTWLSTPAAPTQNVAQPAPVRVVVAPRQKTSRTFDIEDGGLRIFLEEGAEIYPKLGCIINEPPLGKPYEDCPGIDHDGAYQPRDWHTFRSPSGAKRQVEIRNYW